MNPVQSDSSPIDSDHLLDRRTALKSMSIAGVAVLTALGVAQPDTSLAAQDATPVITSVPESTKAATMFVQLAEGGSWTPHPDQDGVFILTMYMPSNQTIFFSDRPDRIVGAVGTDTFIDQLGFTPANPPNAAAVVNLADGTRDVLIIELFNPAYTQLFGEEGGDVLTYEATVLTAYEGDGLTPWVGLPDDDQLPAEFNEMSLFIDDCPPINACCSNQTGKLVGVLPDYAKEHPSCYWFPWGCYSCIADDQYFFNRWCSESHSALCREANKGCHGCKAGPA
jgi:hypothetical protein